MSSSDFSRTPETLVDILDLERLETNLFRGRSPDFGWQRVFGGQVIGQALAAAARTVEGRDVHSLHAYFMLPGDPSVPIVYEVERIRDGGSFTTRRVKAIQHGRPIFSLSASFQVPEEGLEHQIAMPEGVPDPESLPNAQEIADDILAKAPEPIRRYWQRPRPLDLRPAQLGRYVDRSDAEPRQMMWVRTKERLPDDDALHRCALAYASDMTLLDTSLYAHGRSVFDTDLQVASLDHAMWFHRPFRVDEWILYVQDSPASAGGRGFTRGSLYDRAGHLVASVAQEGLIRRRLPAKDAKMGS
ncbi:acyl-CoA thioesterase II [Methylobrevis pamukkalensis]|uniref:Acyl-CoA thioesterase 2 n=1 Tax=Methylobrevis pamukkalensis TaxID=1439726 RepID=A0A1E3GXR5_9HYPH|nr:acyl-CoA thioesterase II [Methylobrevis pamukkalensis]ODN68715.1 Acyl-CoA thioesterase 2 [Methylobrevis pamukkalensis]